MIDVMEEWVDRLGEKQNNEGKSHPLYPFDRGEISPTCRKATSALRGPEERFTRRVLLHNTD